jgi:hypothetical protein
MSSRTSALSHSRTFALSHFRTFALPHFRTFALISLRHPPGRRKLPGPFRTPLSPVQSA